MINLLLEEKNIAEDDVLRSEYLRKVIQEYVPLKDSNVETTIPKVVVQFWHNLDNIPSDVQECIKSWEKLELQGFKRVLYDSAKAREFISKEYGESNVTAFDRCHHPAMQCDYFRLCYIHKYGGFYIDADEIYKGTEYKHYFQDNRLKIQPLCYDIETGEMIKLKIFIQKGEYSAGWIFYVNNNPIIAPANHPIIRLALDRSTRILLSSDNGLDIQSTTGPGNLSASIVKHLIDTKSLAISDFMIIPDWENISYSPWPLSYRNDKRNWRLWRISDKWEDSI